jgi:hypothetical protein
MPRRGREFVEDRSGVGALQELRELVGRKAGLAEDVPKRAPGQILVVRRNGYP